MSITTVLGVTPDRPSISLLELRNGWGWSPTIWDRLLQANGLDIDDRGWVFNNEGLYKLWRQIETLPEWQQAPLVLTFDTGVIPYQAFRWAAEMLDEFERQLPEDPAKVNHVPAVAQLLHSCPKVPMVGIHGTSVAENLFDVWGDDDDTPRSGIPLSEMYLLPQHRGDTP